MSDDICTELSTLADDKSITTWDDAKRRDFVDVFKKRAIVGCYLFSLTAHYVKHGAQYKKFISPKHIAGLPDSRCYGHKDLDGRNDAELREIAQKRADAILAELPPLKEAIQIISPETAKKLDKLAALKEEANTLFTRMTELAEPIDMADDAYQSMTVAAFREMVQRLLDERKETGRKLDDLAEKGTALENEINKALYSGIPGLSEAVCKTVKDLIEREKALDEVTRRIEERVMFGDSQAALEMLQRFEKDEVTVSSEVRAEFRKALDALKLQRKQLKGKGRK
jgi:hypothetical protein